MVRGECREIVLNRASFYGRVALKYVAFDAEIHLPAQERDS